MNKILTILATVLVALSACANANDGKFKIEGKGENGLTVMLIDGRNVLDSVKVTNGSFAFETTQAPGTFMMVALSRERMLPFVVDGGSVACDFVTNKVSGSELNNRFQECQERLSQFDGQQQELLEKYYSTEDVAVRKQIETDYDKIAEQKSAVVKQIIAENKDNVLPAYYIINNVYDFDIDELKTVCAEGTGYFNHPLMQTPKQMLAGMLKRAPGQKFTDIEENDLQGNPHKLSEYVGKGQYVLVDFWASWCGPCRAEMPNVKAAYEKYHSKGFEIVGLSFDSKHDAWEKSINDLGLNWIHLSDLKGWETVAGDAYGVRSIPASILVDPQGVIVAEGLRGEKLAEKLAEIYGE